MATFKIDGNEIEIVPGRDLIRTASDHGIYIPHYCYHPGLTAPANCRMCLVEIETGGRKGLVPACTTRPGEGMSVDTQSAVVKRNQAAVMEFLLINHPLDCPVCDQAGECDLQDYSFTYGPEGSRFHEKKTVQPKKDIGKHIMLYSDRCIRCTRCIRFCDEISGTNELGYFNRGVHNEIDIFPGIRLDNRMSGNTVDICPVGALLDKEFLFKQRVWFLKGQDSVCPGCSAGCNIRIDHNKDRIYRLVARENLEVNDYWMCDDGRHGWGFIHRDERLLFPSAGRGQYEQLVLWEAAFAAIREGFGRIRDAHGAGAIAGIASGHLTNEENYLFGRLMKEGLGVSEVGLASHTGAEGDVPFKCGFTIRADKCANTRGVKEVMAGLGVQVLPVADIWTGIRQGRIKGLYVLGGDFAPDPSEAEVDALKMLGFLVVQDILRNDATQAADVVLPGAAFAEKDGTFTNHGGRVQRIRPAFRSPGDSRPDWEILRDLGVALGVAFEFSDAAAVLNDLSTRVKAFAGVSFESVDGHGQLLATG